MADFHLSAPWQVGQLNQLGDRNGIKGKCVLMNTLGQRVRKENKNNEKLVLKCDYVRPCGGCVLAMAPSLPTQSLRGKWNYAAHCPPSCFVVLMQPFIPGCQ